MGLSPIRTDVTVTSSPVPPPDNFREISRALLVRECSSITTATRFQYPRTALTDAPVLQQTRTTRQSRTAGAPGDTLQTQNVVNGRVGKLFGTRHHYRRQHAPFCAPNQFFLQESCADISFFFLLIRDTRRDLTPTHCSSFEKRSSKRKKDITKNVSLCHIIPLYF